VRWVKDKYVKGWDGKNGDDEIWRSNEYSGLRSRVEGDRRNEYRGGLGSVSLGTQAEASVARTSCGAGCVRGSPSYWRCKDCIGNPYLAFRCS